MIEILVKAKLSEQDVKLIAKEVAFINGAKKQVVIPTDQEIQYTVSEVAKMSKQTVGTITRHIRNKLLTGSKVGKSWKITQENYLKYITNEE